MLSPECREYNVVLIGSGDTESGKGGSTIGEILRFSALGLIAVHVDVVICNNSERLVPGFYKKIKDHNNEFEAEVEVRKVNRTDYPPADDEEVEEGAQTLAEAKACADIFDDAEADVYALGGYMKKIVGQLLKKPGINTHPGPLENPDGLPGVDTKGLHGIEVEEAVLDRGYPYSAHTAHEVVAEYDAGSILAWRPVLVRPGDTAQILFNRVQDVEKACYPRDIENYAFQKDF
ncbi:MAG TPA: formyltransferase family protein [Candidatus Saccharimonadales bacterium]|nr:formyltransferase family protein [Candidatus Saccharimonadales bacterium]